MVSGSATDHGISIAEITREFGSAADPPMIPFLMWFNSRDCWNTIANELSLTQQGRLFANEVFARFLGVASAADDAAKVIHLQGVSA